MKKISIFSFLYLFLLSAQNPEQNTILSSFYQEGKIYVVLVIILVIFIGIIGYLIHLDRKITTLEKSHKS
jgi:hypothetical protein